MLKCLIKKVRCLFSCKANSKKVCKSSNVCDKVEQGTTMEEKKAPKKREKKSDKKVADAPKVEAPVKRKKP